MDSALINYHLTPIDPWRLDMSCTSSATWTAVLLLLRFWAETYDVHQHCLWLSTMRNAISLQIPFLWHTVTHYITQRFEHFCSVSKWSAVSRRTSGKQPVWSRHTNSDRRRATCDPPYSRTWDSEKARLDLLHLYQLQNCYCGSQWNPMFIFMQVCLFFPLNWFAWTIMARNWSCYTSIKISRILHDLPGPVQLGWSWRGFFTPFCLWYNNGVKNYEILERQIW